MYTGEDLNRKSHLGVALLVAFRSRGECVRYSQRDDEVVSSHPSSFTGQFVGNNFISEVPTWGPQARSTVSNFITANRLYPFAPMYSPTRLETLLCQIYNGSRDLRPLFIAA
jgi:hypothetical protein